VRGWYSIKMGKLSFMVPLAISYIFLKNGIKKHSVRNTSNLMQAKIDKLQKRHMETHEMIQKILIDFRDNMNIHMMSLVASLAQKEINGRSVLRYSLDEEPLRDFDEEYKRWYSIMWDLIIKFRQIAGFPLKPYQIVDLSKELN
jgi:hypothetical protein